MENKIYEMIEQFKNEVITPNNLNMGIVKVEDIAFFPELREYCKMNTCGNYGKNHMCPPLIGETDELIAQAKEYAVAIAIQGIYELEDSYDYEGMMAGQDTFKANFTKVIESAKTFFNNPMILSAGGCQVCPSCAAKENKPCRFPDKAYASLETYVIQVSIFAEKAGLKYINGENTVTYFGGIFLKPA